jgi:PTH1 family peptidyl-tRNA hydrolase
VKIVVGLGNPGREYASTRHNIGFMIVDELSRRLGMRDSRTRFRALLSEGFDNAQKLVLVKPQTYMNLSGISVREAASWYKTPVEDLLVVADDIDLPFGVLRMRAQGSSGGHNGLKSIIAELGTDEVPRLRIGVGRGRGDATRQVLTRFTVEEETALPEIVDAAVECVLVWERQGIIAAMNHCNRRASAGDGMAGAPGEATAEKTNVTEPNGGDARHTIRPSAAS